MKIYDVHVIGQTEVSSGEYKFHYKNTSEHSIIVMMITCRSPYKTKLLGCD